MHSTLWRVGGESKQDRQEKKTLLKARRKSIKAIMGWISSSQDSIYTSGLQYSFTFENNKRRTRRRTPRGKEMIILRRKTELLLLSCCFNDIKVNI